MCHAHSPVGRDVTNTIVRASGKVGEQFSSAEISTQLGRSFPSGTCKDSTFSWADYDGNPFRLTFPAASRAVQRPHDQEQVATLHRVTLTHTPTHTRTHDPRGRTFFFAGAALGPDDLVPGWGIRSGGHLPLKMMAAAAPMTPKKGE